MSRYPGRILSSTAPTVNANTAKGIWTLDEAMRYTRAGQWPVPTGNGDPYFQYNTMLLPGQGTTGAQNNTFLDSSTNNFTVNRSGNTTQGTFTPFSGTEGNWSNFFDGSNDQLTVPSNAALGMSTGDFTIELWYYQLSRGSGNTLLAPSTDNLNIYITTAGLLGYYNGSSQDTALTVPLNQWGHIAVVRSSGTLKVYYNGAQVLSQANSINYGTASWYIGTNPAGVGASNGFMSNVRIVKGVAVYTGDFTPPTAPLASTQSAGTNIAAITGTQTSLLTCQNNRFIDNSTNAFAITANNGVAVTPFQPFGAPTSAYSASTIGGSGYFDGSGDYLTIANNNAFAFGTGNFTVECWVYPTSYTGGSADVILSTYQSGTVGWTIAIGTGGGVFYCAAAGDTQVIASSVAPSQQWFHLAMVRSGTTLAFFVNGVRAGTLTDSTNITSTTELSIGTNTGGGALNFIGYMSGARIVKGTAVYDPTQTTLTIPTAPLTAITNTSALLNYTNAGIIDNAQDNNLETVGGAQISTTQYKWGASSMYFDGTGDYLIPSSSTTNLQAFGTGDFTIEFWFYSNNSGSQQMLYDSRPASTNGNYITLYKSSSNVLELYVNSATRITGTATIAANTWYHVALSRTGGGTKLYVNGNQTGSTYADTTNYLNASNRPVIASDGATLGNIPLNGYIQDLRITKGYARYPYNFTAPTAAFPLFWQAAATPSSDPYFDYTTLLLPGNGTNGAQNNTFLDSSTNAFTITRNGNTTQGTFTPFSQTGWGIYSDGSGDSVTAPSNTAFAFGTGDFTIEFWAFIPTWTNEAQLIGAHTAFVGYDFNLQQWNSGQFRWLDSSLTLESGYVPVTNQWNHYAITRQGTSLKIFVNGIQTASGSSSANIGSNRAIGLLGDTGGAASQIGYISNVRIVKGGALYTSNFTPSTTPLTTTVSSGTVSLLTAQSNRFIDNSANNFTMTVNGNASVQAFSPFNPTAAYSTSTVGGSGYFDGTGDYLTVASNANLTLGSSDFTIELWWYPLAFNSDGELFTMAAALGTLRCFAMYSSGSNGTLAAFAGTGGGSWDIVNNLSMGTAIKNAWNHMAFTRSGSTFSTYLNGSRIATTTASGTLGSQSLGIGANNAGGAVAPQSYISGARMIKGTALYTGSTYTVPTEPPTAVTNTNFLANFTNGGIIDNTAKNNLETVGGASISTTVSKFGGSSMYFDGTGDWLLMPAGDKFAFGTGDYTVEAWVYFTSITTTDLQIIFLSGSTGGNNFYFHIDGNQISVGTSAAFISNQATSFSTATWYHVAACRYSGTLRLFVNGVQIGSSVSDTTNWISAGSARIGANESGTQTVFGYINDHRVTKGIARYTQNFTPPTTAFLTL